MAPQKLLVGYAESVVTSTSITDCLTQCLNSQQRFAFQCASGMYYTSYNRPSKPCHDRYWINTLPS
uniref:Apple domain-containing protein n=1 Tax=Romanomermis culicivorax TaxID=13658 RepID=A0A915ITD0_ROMCU